MFWRSFYTFCLLFLLGGCFRWSLLYHLNCKERSATKFTMENCLRVKWYSIKIWDTTLISFVSIHLVTVIWWDPHCSHALSKDAVSFQPCYFGYPQPCMAVVGAVMWNNIRTAWGAQSCLQFSLHFFLVGELGGNVQAFQMGTCGISVPLVLSWVWFIIEVLAISLTY